MTIRNAAVDNYPGQIKLGSDPTLRPAVQQTAESRRLGMFLALMDQRGAATPPGFAELRARAEAYAAHIATFAADPFVYGRWADFADRDVSRVEGA